MEILSAQGRSMTYEEFLAALEATPRDWWVVAGLIRFQPEQPRGVPSCCPIEACCPGGFLPSGEAALQLGLSDDVAAAIIAAADNAPGHDPAVRSDLLCACDLSPMSR